MQLIKMSVAIFGVLTALQLTACAQKPAEPERIGMANPATNWCIKVGGTPSQVNTDAGVVGYCTLPSGEQVEQWTLYRQAHPASTPAK